MLTVRFYRSALGNEPVRDWLRALSAAERKVIGDEIRTVQYGWPIGMPLVRKLQPALWEVRLDQRIARVLFTIVDDEAVLLHGFIKKSQRMPMADLRTAVDRYKVLAVAVGRAP